MHQPSPRTLSNRVALYHVAPSQDDDGGVAADPYGGPFATDVPCSVQPARPERFFDRASGRLTQRTWYHVVFRANPALVADDKVVWVDDAGVRRELYVHGGADQAGRGAAFIVTCEERT